MNTLRLTRRRLALLAAGTLVTSAAFAQSGGSAKQEFRIGYQKAASLLVLQKAQGSLEKKLTPLGFGVRWVEFPAGPQLLEGLNVGAIDIGFVGEAPPIFAQAAGARFYYVGFEPPAPKAEALLVPKDSPIRSVADLKGRKVVLNIVAESGAGNLLGNLLCAVAGLLDGPSLPGLNDIIANLLNLILGNL